MSNQAIDNYISQKSYSRYNKSLEHRRSHLPTIILKENKSLNSGSLQLSAKRSSESHIKDSKWKINKKYIEIYKSKEKAHQKSNSSIKNQNLQIQQTNLKDIINTQSPLSKKLYELTQSKDTTPKNRQLWLQKSVQDNVDNTKNDVLNKGELNKLIQKTNNFIKAIKKDNRKLLKIKFRNATQSFQLPQLNCNDHLLSYLSKKQLRTNKAIRGQINQKMIRKYISHSCQKDKFKIDEKARRFLMKKLRQDHENQGEQLQQHKLELLRNNIKQQLTIKKMKFDYELVNRRNSAFMSFLSLSNKEKQNVLQRKYMKCNKTQIG